VSGKTQSIADASLAAPQPRHWRRRLRLAVIYLAPHRGQWLLICAATLFSSLLALLQPWPATILVDYVLGSKPMPPFLSKLSGLLPGIDNPRGAVVWIALSGLFFYALSSVAEVVINLCWVRAGQRTVYHLAEDLFARIQRRSLLFHARNPIGDLVARVAGDSWSVYKLADGLFFAPAHALILMIGMSIVLVRINPMLTLLTLITAPAMTLAAVSLGDRIRRASRASREIDSSLQSHVHRTLTGMALVQSFVQERREHDRFMEFAGEAIKARRHTTLIQSLSGLASGFASTAGTAAVLWFGGRLAMKQEISPGALLVYLAYFNQLQAQFKSLLTTYNEMQVSGAAVDRVCEILEVEPEIRDGPIELPRAAGRVELEHVDFGYEPGRQVLHDVTFAANPGEMIAIVGPTGAGKSTLMGLVPRLFEPWRGSIRIDGHDLRELTVASLRRQIEVVQQEPFLFPISVAENIAYGCPNATQAQIEAAAQAASIHTFISKMPRGYDTIIGERGATLSGGERQRLAIARALLRDAPILILDEPTSGLDAQTEASITGALDRLTAGRTVLVIAHRLSTIRRASAIVVLQQGRVVETGTHAELLARGGLYADMHAAQVGASIAAEAPPNQTLEPSRP
jgi:ATP-binding cassette subfamily B protein/subfamily B ATP-binding cassette protein MsbA